MIHSTNYTFFLFHFYNKFCSIRNLYSIKVIIDCSGTFRRSIVIFEATEGHHLIAKMGHLP
jgi:hypothetical protein